MFFSKLFNDSNRVLTSKFKSAMYDDSELDEGELDEGELEEFERLKDEIWSCLLDSLKKNLDDRHTQKDFEEECDWFVEDELELVILDSLGVWASDFCWEDSGASGFLFAEYKVGNVSKLKDSYYKKQYEILAKDGFVMLDDELWICEYLLESVDSICTFKGDYERLQELAEKTGREGYSFCSRTGYTRVTLDDYDKENDTATLRAEMFCYTDCLDEY